MQNLNIHQNSNKPEILVIAAQQQDRETLRQIVSAEYPVLTAENGKAAMAFFKQNQEHPSLVLLDLTAPGSDGIQFLTITRSDPYISVIPVIVITDAEHRKEEDESIHRGATDYIHKPFDAELILRRIYNILRYRESLSALTVVEHDDLTGLYSMAAFYHHVGASMADEAHPYDLMLLSIRDYAAITRTYGEKRSANLVRFVADQLRQLFPGALIARQEGAFYVFGSTEQAPDREVLCASFGHISSDAPIPNVRLSAGVYQHVDFSQPATVLCDRARMGMLSAESDGTFAVAYFDEEMERQWIRQQKLLLAFESALKNEEFLMYLQPKVEISTGKIVAAEALSRWQSHDGELIMPGFFIPMLEQEDLIWKLDEYMYRKVCDYQRKQRAAGNPLIPISVNLSRSSLFSAGIVERYQKIAAENQITFSMIPLEITESALFSDQQIQKICNDFVEAGFLLHIDDFGSGYSSLSSLVSIPFSELKIDRSLIYRIGTEKGNLIVRRTVQIAKDLGMTVIAEGVEEPEQLQFLQEVNCNLTQGFYYATPMSAEDFNSLFLGSKVDNPSEYSGVLLCGEN